MLVKDPDDLKRRLAAVARYPDIEVSTRPPDPPTTHSNPPERTPTMADTKVTDDSTKGGRRAGGRIRPARRARHPQPRPAGPFRRMEQVVIARTAEFEPERRRAPAGLDGR